MGEVVYDYDELGRPIVADLTRGEDGRLRNGRAYPLSFRMHDWGLGSVRVVGRGSRRLVAVLRHVHRLGRLLGLPDYVVDTAALTARRRAEELVGVRWCKVEVIAKAFLKHAANLFGICVEFDGDGWKVNKLARSLRLKIVNICDASSIITYLMNELGISNPEVRAKAMQYLSRLQGRKARIRAGAAALLALRHYGIYVTAKEVASILGVNHAVIAKAAKKASKVRICGEYYAETPAWLG